MVSLRKILRVLFLISAVFALLLLVAGLLEAASLAARGEADALSQTMEGSIGRMLAVAFFVWGFRRAGASSAVLTRATERWILGGVVAVPVLLGVGAWYFAEDPVSTRLDPSHVSAREHSNEAPAEGTTPKAKPVDPATSTKTIQLASLAPEGSSFANIIETWSQDLARESDDRLRLAHHAGGTAGDDLDALQKIREGKLDAAFVSTAGLASVAKPALIALAAPGMVKTYDELKRAQDQLLAVDSPLFAKTGFVVLASGVMGHNRIFSKKAFHRPSDLKENQVWAWKNDPALEHYWTAVGVSPVRNIGVPMVYRGLVDETIDTVVATAIAAVAFQWYVRLSYVSKQSLSPSIQALLIGKEVFDGLSADDRSVLVRSARRTVNEVDKMTQALDDEAYALIAKRLTVVDLSPYEEEWDAAEQRARQASGHSFAVQSSPPAGDEALRPIPRLHMHGMPQDDVQVFTWYRKAAEQGAAEAQFNLGICYDEGVGVQQDFVVAAQWFEKAAEQGFAPAQHNLALAYADGFGVVQDDARAIDWFRKAAARGSVHSQYSLGAMYARGRGVQQNLNEAEKWYRLAAAQGHEAAVAALQQLRAGKAGL